MSSDPGTRSQNCDRYRQLVVIVPEAISQWIAKGEVIDRYFNPGELFKSVHVVVCSHDAPDPAALQRLVGNAALSFEIRPLSKIRKVGSLGLQPALLRRWARRAANDLSALNASLVRCHGAYQNGLIARELKRRYGVPYVVSLHTNPDVDVRDRPGRLVERLYHRFTKRCERAVLCEANLVMPVYEAIIPYLKGMSVSNFKVHYNVINSGVIEPKRDYTLSSPVRLISVGRLYQLKNPAEIIRALILVQDAVLTVVGDGPLRQTLEALAVQLGVSERVVFAPSLPNDEVVRMLRESDVFVTHSEHWELSKSVLEAMLVGLPVVMNYRRGPGAPELALTSVVQVANTPEGYADAVLSILGSVENRERMGRSNRKVAMETWSPSITEPKFVETYREVVDSKS